MSSGGNLYEDGGIDQTIQQILNRLSALERSNKLTSASIGAGGLTVKDGGAINVEDSSGDVQVVLDSMGLDVGSGLVVVDEDGIDIDNGLVVLDDTGLQVIGGYVTPAWFARDTDGGSNFSLTGTDQVVGEVTFSPPAWVQSLHMAISWHAQISENTADKTLGVKASIGAGTFIQTFMSADDGYTRSTGRTGHATATSFPVTAQLLAQVLTGTNSVNSFDLAVSVIGVRNP